MAINWILLISRQGKVRLAKWFTTMSPKAKLKITKDVTQLVLARRTRMCNFLEYKDSKVVYRRYASLFFVTGISQGDNELVTLEIIHRYVEVLDRYFGNVCELDLIFNFQKAYAILDELIIAGEMQESSKKSVLRTVSQSDAIEEAEQSEDADPRPIQQRSSDGEEHREDKRGRNNEPGRIEGLVTTRAKRPTGHHRQAMRVTTTAPNSAPEQHEQDRQERCRSSRIGAPICGVEPFCTSGSQGTELAGKGRSANFPRSLALLARQRRLRSDMSDFKSQALFEQITEGLKTMDDKEKKDIQKKTNGVFEMHVKNAGGKELVWTIDLKKNAEAYEGKAKGKADVTINLSDDTFIDLADGKVNGQKAFMSGKLKVKGNIMLATKLDGVLKAQKSKL
ncbi:hypothetical protein PaG_03628 [Moesziomyces aphidis]|uniref:AP-1 complex subunit sigma-1 n=2 Tax=Ustilaginaceae TaxID=5268 RepID=W3VKN1_MOEAP|nr:hypothetical protein PaG_03628 [Moesziomyces aphidis]